MPSTAAMFRKLALSLPGSTESAHMGNPDFRTSTGRDTPRIFATLSWQAKGCGVLMLTPEQQRAFCEEQPEIFEPVPGGWGKGGSTLVHFAIVDEATLLGALTTAHRNVLARQQAQTSKRSASTPKSRTSKAVSRRPSAKPKIKL